MLLTNIILPGTLSDVVVEHLFFFIGRQHNKQPLKSNGAVLQGGGEPARLGLPVDAHEVHWHCKNVHLISTRKSQEHCSASIKIFWRISLPSDRLQKVLHSLPTCGEDHGKTNHSFHWLLEHREAGEGILIMLMSNQWHCHDDSQIDLMDKEWWFIDNRNSDLKPTLKDNECWRTYMVIPRVITM